jgi:hypothetical protein
VTLESVRTAATAAGLSWRGAFHPDHGDLPDDARVGTLVLLGFIGRENWDVFSSSPEANDGAPDPLDRWSKRVVTKLAGEFGAKPYFPFGGPPWAPFIEWGKKAEAVHRSAIGMLIHPDYGLWHSWRGALAFKDRFDLPAKDRRPSPCETCSEKPCLSACPAGAFASGEYDVAACKGHIAEPEGEDCMEWGCLARRACPIGAGYRYGKEQAAFYMDAFLNRALR